MLDLSIIVSKKLDKLYNTFLLLTMIYMNNIVRF